MAENKVHKTAMLVGDFGGNNEKVKDKFIVFSYAGRPNLEYDAFVNHYDIQTTELGPLNSGNPFFNFFKPIGPPNGAQPVNASQMAEEVVSGFDQLAKSIASTLSQVDEKQSKATAKEENLKVNGRPSNKPFINVFDAVIGGKDNIGWEKFETATKLGLETLRSEGKTGNISYSTLSEKRSLFRPLLWRNFFDRLNSAAEEAAKAFMTQCRKSQIDNVKIDLGDRGRWKRFVTSLATRNDVLDPADLGTAVGVDHPATQEFQAWLKNFDGLAKATVIGKAEVHEALSVATEQAKTDWKAGSGKRPFPAVFSGILSEYARARSGGAMLSEDLMVDVLHNAILGMIAGTSVSAQDYFAKARAEGRKDFANESEDNFRDNINGYAKKLIELLKDDKAIQDAESIACVAAHLAWLATVEPTKRSEITSWLLLAQDPNCNSKLSNATAAPAGDFATQVEAWFVEARQRRHDRGHTGSKDDSMSSASSTTGTSSSGVDRNTETVRESEGSQSSDSRKAGTGDSDDGKSNQGSVGNESEHVSTPSPLPGQQQNEHGEPVDVKGGAPVESKIESSHEDKTSKVDKKVVETGKELDALDSLLKSVSINLNGQLPKLHTLLPLFHTSIHKSFTILLSQKDLPDAQKLARESAFQYIHAVMLIRQGLQFGDPDSAILRWIFEIRQHQGVDQVLKNVPVTEFIDLDSLVVQRNAMDDAYTAAIGDSIPLLSKLYGVECLMQSLNKDGYRLVVWNGNSATAVARLASITAMNPGPPCGDSVPLCVYFADEPDTVTEALLSQPTKNRFPPCLLDAGPDWVKGRPWLSTLPDIEQIPCLSLCGPGVRLRGLTDDVNEGLKANNGSPSSPLIPAGFLVLAAAMNGTEVVSAGDYDVHVLPTTQFVGTGPQEQGAVRFNLTTVAGALLKAGLLGGIKKVLASDSSQFGGDILAWLERCQITGITDRPTYCPAEWKFAVPGESKMVVLCNDSKSTMALTATPGIYVHRVNAYYASIRPD